MTLYLLLFFCFPFVKLAAVDAKWLFQTVLLWDWNCVSSVLHRIGVQFCPSIVSDIIQVMRSAISTNNFNISNLKYIKFCNPNILNYTQLIQLYWNVKRFSLTFWGYFVPSIHLNLSSFLGNIGQKYCHILLFILSVYIFVFCGCMHLWVNVWIWFPLPCDYFGRFLHLNIICCVALCCPTMFELCRDFTINLWIFFSGCESNKGLAWGFIFLAGLCYSYVLWERLVIQVFAWIVL